MDLAEDIIGMVEEDLMSGIYTHPELQKKINLFWEEDVKILSQNKFLAPKNLIMYLQKTYSTS